MITHYTHFFGGIQQKNWFFCVFNIYNLMVQNIYGVALFITTNTANDYTKNLV